VCGCANQYGSEPNTNVCPVLPRHARRAPVANEEALRLTALTGYLLNARFRAAKFYLEKIIFYPDPASKKLPAYAITPAPAPRRLCGF